MSRLHSALRAAIVTAMQYSRFASLLAAFLAIPSFAAETDPQELKFISNPRQLILEGKRSGEGYFHPDGNALIFQSEREPGNPFYQMYLLDLLSGESARVSPGVGKTTCGFFQPGSSRVLFASTHHDPKAPGQQKAELDFRASGKERRYSWDYEPAMEIWSANQDGTQLQRLTNTQGYDAEGSYSPDGKQIVFCSLRSAYERDLTAEERARLEKDPAFFGELYIMNADGSNVRQLTKTPGYDGGPFFSPDGTRIVWRRFDEQGMQADVYTMALDGSDVRRVTDFKSMSWAPYYHPGGEYIVFTSNKLGFENFELFVVDTAGQREPVRVSFTGGFDGLPVFSPDGKRLCWSSGRTIDTKSQLFMAEWNHEGAKQALAASPLRGSAVPAKVEVPAGFTPEITIKDLQAQVQWLADPARGGRGTGTPGAEQTGNWAADYFKTLGLQGVNGSYFLPFSFNAGERILPEQNRLSFGIPEPSPFKVDQDFRPLSFTENAEVSGDLVFAGYGLSVPEGNGPRYNSYDDLDVKDKVVLVLRYVPEGTDPQRRAQLNRYAGLRYKAMMARERGAKAVIFVAGPNSPQPGELLPLSGDNTVSGSGIVAASVTGSVAEKLLAASGKKLKEVQDGLDNENPHVEGAFAIPNTVVTIQTGVEHIHKTDRNVLAAIPPGVAGASEEWVVVGAHYDHLGTGSGSNSMARSGEEKQIHPGADDNGSGVATIMELAAALAQERSAHPEQFRRGILFALWSGEEIGIIGSSSFVEKPPVELGKIAAYVNFDMVGRLRDNRLSMQALGSSKGWRRMIEKRNVAAGFNLVLQDDPYLPTDVTSFYPKKIPVLNFFTGAHDDYHRPTDTADKLNYEGVQRIATFAKNIVLDLAAAAERPDFARVERSDRESGGSRETLRAYLGTIPDYTTEVVGVKITGVRGGSPGEKGGLQGGDVLVELGGTKLANIYDYTYALDAVKIGQPVKVVVQRGGVRVELMVTPEARK